VGAFSLLIALVAMSPNRFLHDELFYKDYLPLLHRDGLTPLFLNSLYGTVGPLYAFVHIAFEPITHLEPVRMRLLNVFLLLVTAYTLRSCLSLHKQSNSWLSAGSVLFVPMVWVTAGMALTEMPAMFFVTLSLYLQLRGLEVLEKQRSALGWFTASALCLGIAVWGRQPYLLLAPIPIILAWTDKRLRIPAAVFLFVVVALVVPLFAIWHGLVPPSHERVEQGLSVSHALLSLGYSALCYFLLVPKANVLPVKLTLILLVSTVAINGYFGLSSIYPLDFLSWGAVFLVMLAKSTWDSRGDLYRLTAHLGLLCIALSPVFIAHQYSSRYTAMELPYLVLVVQPQQQRKLSSLMTALLGCAIGSISLFGYFFIAHSS